jgi:hypothetical protein
MHTYTTVRGLYPGDGPRTDEPVDLGHDLVTTHSIPLQSASKPTHGLVHPPVQPPVHPPLHPPIPPCHPPPPSPRTISVHTLDAARRSARLDMCGGMSARVSPTLCARSPSMVLTCLGARADSDLQPYACTRCIKRFARSDVLARHVAVIHGRAGGSGRRTWVFGVLLSSPLGLSYHGD